MHRFFIPPQWIDGDRVVIEGRQVHQLRDVLRLAPGDHIVALDNSGWEYEVELGSLSPEHVEGVICSRNAALTEPATRIVLYQALLKGNRFEIVLQKCTELGVSGFVPLLCERCVMGHLRDVTEGKMERWQRIIAEAAEQSRRGKLPFLQPVMFFQQACQQAKGLSLMAWEGEQAMGLRALLRSRRPRARKASERKPFLVNIVIGPEGGFSQSEVEFARNCGLVPITMGERILRAETAGIAATSVVLYEFGDLDPLPPTGFQLALSLH